MKRAILIALLAVVSALAGQASAQIPLFYKPAFHGDEMCPPPGVVPWHDWYYNAEWGIPVAQLLPPTVAAQTHWGWGVGNTRVNLICPQFGRTYPGMSTYQRDLFQPMPPWPSDTDQFGYYYVRGPWH